MTKSMWNGRGRTNFAVWLCVVLALLPFAWLVIVSLKSADDIFAGSSKLFFVPTLDNYRALLTPPFIKSFVNSAVVSTVSTLLALIIGVPEPMRWHARRAEKAV